MNKFDIELRQLLKTYIEHDRARGDSYYRLQIDGAVVAIKALIVEHKPKQEARCGVT